MFLCNCYAFTPTLRGATSRIGPRLGEALWKIGQGPGGTLKK